MAMKKWIMKQYWRVGTIRTISSLALSMFVLGKLYYIYFPILNTMDLIGALMLGSIFILVFIAIGWLYDVKAKMWSQEIQAGVQRNPFQYVPDYRELAIDYPMYYAFLHTIQAICIKMNGYSDSINACLSYLNKYFKRSVSRQDILEAKLSVMDSMKRNPFTSATEQTPVEISISSKAKLLFRVAILRLTWIQRLTGLFQDVLIFGLLVTILIFFGGEEFITEIVPIEFLILSIVFISLPLFVILASLGWVYDKKFQIWSPELVITAERNPYQYIAELKQRIMVFPMFFVILGTLSNILESAGIGSNILDNALDYLQKYRKLSESRDDFIGNARTLRTSFGELFQNTYERN